MTSVSKKQPSRRSRATAAEAPAANAAEAPAENTVQRDNIAAPLDVLLPDSALGSVRRWLPGPASLRLQS